MVIPDLNHLLADVVLGADAALGTCPPGQKIRGLEQVLALGASVGQAPSTHWLLPVLSQMCLAPLGGPKRHPSRQQESLPQAEGKSLLPPLRPNHRLFQTPGVHGTYQLQE